MGSRWVHGERHLPRYRERSRHRSAQLPRRLCRTISKSCSWPLRVLSLGSYATVKSARRELSHRSKREALFDDFIGRSRESHRHVDAQRSGGLEVEGKFVFDRLHPWQLTRLLTLEDASDVDAGLTISIDDTSSIACQLASLDKLAAVVHDRQPVARRD